jgi:tetratricopeptide (TPR) repeat protein
MKRVLTICMFFIATLVGAQDATLFNQGNENYKAELYNQAIQNWKKILDNGNHSAALYFNIANAHYKLNEVGPSIYYYEKALQLAPNDAEIKTNLSFAENAKIDAIEPLPKTVFSKWYDAIATVLTFDGWAILAIVFSSFFVVFFLAYFFAPQEQKKRFFFTTAMLSVFLFIGAFTMAYLTYQDVRKDTPAIIFAEEIDVKTAPKLNSDTTFVLHEGTKVQILDTNGDWLLIRIINGKDGWIPASDVKKL